MKIDYQGILQTIINLVSRIFNISNMVNFLTIITSIITILSVLHARRQGKFKIYTQYILNNIFIDRKITLKEVSKAIKEKNVVINIYGKKGVGKSNFLRFYCDFINHKLKKKDKKILKKQFSKLSEYNSVRLFRTKSFYIEISGYQNRSELNAQISELITGKTGFSNIDVANKLRKAFIFHKRIIIIIDNVNTSGLEKELENMIKIFYSISPKFCFIIGSIKELYFLGLLNASYKNIELINFEENDVREFIYRNYPVVDCNILADVLKLSQGLPILVNLFLKGFKETGILENNIQIKKYVHQITENLSERYLHIAQIIALLSITKANIPLELLYFLISDFNSNDIVNLEDNALIEYHPITQKIKMHEIFRDFINSFYIMEEQKYILKIHKYFKENSTEYESAYYAILINDIGVKDSVISTIEKAILNENYSFLLLFGEHIKNIFGFQLRIGNISTEAFYTILLGYLEGLIGVGDYPAAQEIIDRCALTIRDINSTIRIKLSFLMCNLYHLQNKYQEAIGSYEILLDEICNEKSKNIFCKYEAKCLWGIAHSYRHEGLNYTLAELYYREAIKVAKATNQRSIILKCQFELVTMYVLQNNKAAIDIELAAIDKLFEELPSNRYIYTRIAYKKVRSRYFRVFNINTSEDDLELLESVLKEYELQRKRLQYNTFFDIAEHYRHKNQFSKAIENYSIALSFSKKNHDINLSTMSRLGLALCDISQSTNNDLIIQTLRNVQRDCIESHLHTNKILAELIIDIIQIGELSQETQNSLKYIGINSKCDELYREYLDVNNIHLILM